MVELGEDAGVATSALLTNMNVPLGLTIGNANEVRESVEVLAGGGPPTCASSPSRWPARCSPSPGVHDADVEAALDDGRAMDTWRARDPCAGRRSRRGAARRARAARRHRRPRRRARRRRRRCRSASPRGAWAPAGRARRTRCSTPRASTCTRSPATPCAKGEPLFTLHADEPARFARALEAVEGAWTIGDAGDAVEDGGPLIADRIGR